MTKTTQRLITHSGSFHADDVLACSVLRRLFPDSEVVRTRDRELLDSTTDADVVFDVGYEYDPVLRRYDHHQPGRPHRLDGSPYSSFGLVWLHHGRSYIAPLLGASDSDLIDAVWEDMDRRFVLSIDHTDNGYVPEGGVTTSTATDISLLVEDFVPAWNDAEADHDARFLAAVELFSTLLERRVSKAASLARARAAVLRAFENAPDPRIVVIPDYMPVGSVVRKHGFDQALYLVERSRSGEWFVNCVRPDGEPFGQRKPLPLAWAGLRGQDLAEVSGVADAIFCHGQRFTCAAQSRESALELAYKALACAD